MRRNADKSTQSVHAGLRAGRDGRRSVLRLASSLPSYLMMEPLKLIALDKDDLEVVSAHLQDSSVKVSDVFWLPKEKRLVLGVDRFDWLAANEAKEFERALTL
jgi:hypothetical protein